MTALVTGRSRGSSLVVRQVNNLIFHTKSPEAGSQDRGNLVQALVGGHRGRREGGGHEALHVGGIDKGESGIMMRLCQSARIASFSPMRLTKSLGLGFLLKIYQPRFRPSQITRPTTLSASGLTSAKEG